MKEFLPCIIVALLIYMILHQSGCLPNSPAKAPPDTLKIETRIDTSKGVVVVNHWQPRIVVNVIDSTLPVIIDSLAIIRAYYAKNAYDTTFSDSLIKGSVSLSVTQNKLKSFKLKYTALTTTRTITLNEPPRTHLSIGGYIGGRERVDYGLMAEYRDLKKYSYIASYSLGDRSLRVGLLYPIK